MEGLTALEELELGEKKLSVCHYGHQLVSAGNAEMADEKKNVEGEFINGLEQIVMVKYTKLHATYKRLICMHLRGGT